MSNKKTAGETATGSGRAVRLDDIKAEQIAFLPDYVIVRGTLYYRIVWTYAGEGDNLARVGWGWINRAGLPQWATPECGTARHGAFVLGGVRRRGASNSRHGWDLLIDSVAEEASAEGRAE